ncbi:MAG TPA: hypothetical protein VGR26_16165 [Acidimicrobiales bacterium]|nr:hypothetical protein [Acidimicrobiales bacterium]
MVMSLHEVLERRFGVDEDDFTAALVDFADRAGPLALVELDPNDYFGERQQSALRSLGASLDPLEARELGPVAGLAAAHAELVARSLAVVEAATGLGVDTSRVRQRIYARSLYAFKHQGRWLVPAFQLGPRTLVPGLDAVVSALAPGLHPVAVSRWFTTPHADLVVEDEPVSPIDWLAAGGPPDTAAALAEAIDQL